MGHRLNRRLVAASHIPPHAERATSTPIGPTAHMMQLTSYNAALDQKRPNLGTRPGVTYAVLA